MLWEIMSNAPDGAMVLVTTCFSDAVNLAVPLFFLPLSSVTPFAPIGGYFRAVKKATNIAELSFKRER